MIRNYIVIGIFIDISTVFNDFMFEDQTYEKTPCSQITNVLLIHDFVENCHINFSAKTMTVFNLKNRIFLTIRHKL